MSYGEQARSFIERQAGGPARARIERFAEHIGMSETKARRSLVAEGTSWSAVLRSVLSEQAEKLLATHSGKQVAYLLGYGTPTSFYRAYQLWTGVGVRERRAAS